MGMKVGYTELKRIEGRLNDIKEENFILISNIVEKLTSINNNVREDELGLTTTMNELLLKFSDESEICSKKTVSLQEKLSTMLEQTNITTKDVQQNLQNLSSNMEKIQF